MLKNIPGQIIGAQMTYATGVNGGLPFDGNVTVFVKGDNGPQVIGTVSGGICTQDGNGFYSYSPSQEETNYNYVVFTFIGAGAIVVSVQLYPEVSAQPKSDHPLASNR